MDKADFMRRAIELSEKMMADDVGGPFGAVIVRDGKIIGEGYNQVTSLGDPTAHAEVMAIREACRNLGTFTLAGAEIYASCEPCPMCLAAIYWARLDRLYYANSRDDAKRIGFDDDMIYRELTRKIDQRSIPTARLLAEEASRAFDLWLAKPDKTPY